MCSLCRREVFRLSISGQKKKRAFSVRTINIHTCTRGRSCHFPLSLNEERRFSLLPCVWGPGGLDNGLTTAKTCIHSEILFSHSGVFLLSVGKGLLLTGMWKRLGFGARKACEFSKTFLVWYLERGLGREEYIKKGGLQWHDRNFKGKLQLYQEPWSGHSCDRMFREYDFILSVCWGLE